MTLSLCATVALACLFSPKVYIILMHPEKNMRLGKQLKAQANSLKFAAEIPTNPNFSFNSHNHTSDKGSESNNYNNDEKSQPLLFTTQVTVNPFPNNTEN